MLAKEEIDVVDVVLPSDLHYRSRPRGARGRPTFVSGKADGTYGRRTATRLIALAKARGKLLAVGHELRLSSLWGKMKELIDAGEIGDPSML